MNSEFGIIYIPLVCKKIVGADSISARCRSCILGKISVEDEFPVPNRANDFRCIFFRVYHNNKNAIVFILLSDKNNGVRLL